MNTYFTTIGQTLAENKEPNKTTNYNEYIYRVTPICQHLKMDEEHFEKQFKGLKENKATGHDNVASKELNLAGEVIKPGIKSVIRKSIMVKKYPTDYKVVKMKTLFKKGEKTDAGPISILSQVCKEMDIHLGERNILNDN